MSKFTELEKAIIRYVKSGIPTREDILQEIQYLGYSRKEIQEAFTRLRKEGHVYKVSEGWYQTDVDID